MKALQTKKFLGKKSISDAVIPLQSPIKSRPFVANSAPQSQELTQKREKTKQQGFNFAQIPIFPGMKPAMPEILQPKQAEQTLKDLPEVNLAPSSGGQPMPKLVQQKMETSFGTDFSDVRIHEGSQAEKIGAQAYTHGKNIHFRPGKYQPTTQSGQELLGHELTHVVQQRAGQVTAPQCKGVAINTNPQLETEADVLGAKAARGESAQVNGAASSGVQRMQTQGNVVQCVRDGKQRADQPSSKEEDEQAYLADRAATDAVLEEYYTDILDEDISRASPKELAEIASEKDSLLAPVAAEQILVFYHGQEQAASSTDPQGSSQKLDNRKYTPEDLLNEDKQEGSSGLSNSQDAEQEEDNRPLAEVFASIENILAELESELPPDSELRNLAATTRQELSQSQQPPQIPSRNRLRNQSQQPPQIPPRNRLRNQSQQPPQIPSINPQQEVRSLLAMDNTTRAQRIAQLRGQGVGQNVIEDIIRRFDVSENPQQEAQSLLAMDNTTRAQRIAQLRRQGIEQHVIEDIIRRFDNLSNEQDEIARLEGRIPPQTPQQPATRGQKITKGIIGAPFNAISYVTGGPGKEPKKELAAGMKQHETYADQTKILGQDSPNTNIDQIGLQNLPANERDPMTSVTPLPQGIPKQFGNDAAIIGMTRDDVKAIGGLLLFSDNLKKFKKAWKDKTKPRRERIADLSNSTGEMTSAITYTGIVATQAQRGIQHHIEEGGATFGSGAIAAVKKGGKIGTLSSTQQGGFVGGTSLPFDIGKAASGVLTTLPKLITYTDAGLKAAQKENFGGHKSWGRGVKNVGDLTKSAAGAIKDAASLANNAGAGGGAQGTQIIAGGAIAPAAATVVGSAEAIQGGYKFKKAYKNKRNLAEIGDSPTLDQLKEIQKKKMKRAAINTVLGNVTLAAGVVGFSAGPPGLVAATAMGAGVGAFQIGQWGTRKLKQKMRDKGVKGFDPNKTTAKKNEARKELAGNTLAMLNGGISNEEQETIFSSMGLNGNKKDSVVQEVYNSVLAKYLTPQELQQPTTAVNRILKLKADKNNLKKEVSWDKLSNNDFPTDFSRQVKEAAIDKALKKR
ncbi:eCIS core domain-containing protein [Nostoc sp.]|uniref:eCIS core domain-containing protein n=1 Tax=Nostoc sp. TaxID=1180 RepID=UPI002FF84F64